MAVNNNNTFNEACQVGDSPPQPKKRRERYKNFAILLYPDNPEHPLALSKIIQWWDYWYIKHDKDEVITTDDILIDDDGDDIEELKKTHIHCVVSCGSFRTDTQIARELNIDPRFVRPVHNFNAMLLYLLHTGERQKYQYDINEVFSNRISVLKEALYTLTNDTEKIAKVIDIIQNKNCTNIRFALQMLSYAGLTKFALKHYNVVKDLVIEFDNERRFTSYSFVGELAKSADWELVKVQKEVISFDDELPL